MGFSRQEYLNELSFPPPGDLPDPGIEPGSPVLQADALLTELRGNLSHLIRPDSNAFLFYSWVTFHYVYASQFLYLFICLWTSRSTLAWKIPGTEEPGELQSMGSERGEHNSVTKQQEQQPFLPYRPETTEGTRINRASPPHCQTDSFLSPCPLIYEMYIMSMLLSYISIIGIFLLVLVVALLVTKSCSTLATSWTVTCQAPLSMGFFRQEYWSGMLFPSPGESSWPKNWTQVSWIAGRFFTDWVMREAFLLVFCLIISSFYPSFLLFCDLRIQNSLDFTKDNVGLPIFHSYCLKVLRVKGRSRNFATLPTNLKSS